MISTELAKYSCLLAAVVVNVIPLYAQGQVHSEYGDQGMVVSESSYASRIGRDVILEGGNAVDAAVATAIAMAVTWPEAGNIGGGGFMLIRPADGQNPVCIDYREMAPLDAKVDTFAKGESRHTRKAVGVPGTLRGLELAHKKYGSLPWKDLVMPAAKLALEGFSVDMFLANSTNKVLKAIEGKPEFAELNRVYGKPDGSAWKSGDVMILPDLGRTLTTIAEQGADAFYEGPIADLLLKEMQKEGGLIKKEDLDNYQAKIREPIVGTYKDYNIIGSAPPSSGGTVIIQGLNMVEALDLSKDKYNPETMHLLAEVSRRLFLDRARYLGDPDFIDIPEYLTSKEYAKELVAGIDPNRASKSAELADDISLADESDDTTHFSVIDTDGMAVSNTYTIEASWGSRIVVPGAGILLNNEMGDFNWVKGYTNRKGSIGTDANLIEPGKRMLSSQSPIIICKKGRPCLITGSPGGRTIINTVFNVVLNLIHFEMTPQMAVQANRYHHQWMPDSLDLENVDNPPFASIRKELEARGHTVKNRLSQGSAHTIWIDNDSNAMVGVADYRRGGRPAGISSLSIARWDFGGLRGETLKSQPTTGSQKLSWSNEISGCKLDGSDRYLIRRDVLALPDRSYVMFDSRQSRVTVTIEFDGINFAGESKNEKVQFAFLEEASKTAGIIASMTLARNEMNQVVLYGEANGEAGKSVEPKVISTSPRIEIPITIRLSVDQETKKYSIEIRKPTDLEFSLIGSNQTDSKHPIRYGCLRMINDFDSKGEYVRIDSIEFANADQ